MRLAIVGLLLVGSGCATVGPGQAGVLWRSNGGTEPEPIAEGWHYVAPLNQLTIYDLRTLEHNEQLQVLASNGLELGLDTSVRFHVVPKDVAALHREVGPDYYNVILGPVLRSQARRVVGRYTPEEIYSTKRELIEREMRQAVEKAIEGKHLVLEAILVRNVELPQMIQKAIMDKLAEEQRALKMKFVLEHERLEADRKTIEAEGIAAFQNTVAAHLSEPLLRWKQIEALDKLAASQNAKVVLLGGNGRDMPPMMMEAPR
ncbi:MAG TPA: prohibitin family protein [Polyangia bacterium]|nr:prohibitin family protein [Polyangia bacterium]